MEQVSRGESKGIVCLEITLTTEQLKLSKTIN
jgi:hypothetical protein